MFIVTEYAALTCSSFLKYNAKRQSLFRLTGNIAFLGLQYFVIGSLHALISLSDSKVYRLPSLLIKSPGYSISYFATMVGMDWLGLLVWASCMVNGILCLLITSYWPVKSRRQEKIRLFL